MEMNLKHHYKLTSITKLYLHYYIHSHGFPWVFSDVFPCSPDVFQGFFTQAGLRSGLTLTAVVDPIRLASTKRAFAAWRHGGGVVFWGDAGHAFPRIQQRQQLRMLELFGWGLIQWEISRILKWRYVSTIFLAIFCGDIPWNLGLI